MSTGSCARLIPTWLKSMPPKSTGSQREKRNQLNRKHRVMLRLHQNTASENIAPQAIPLNSIVRVGCVESSEHIGGVGTSDAHAFRRLHTPVSWEIECILSYRDSVESRPA